MPRKNRHRKKIKKGKLRIVISMSFLTILIFALGAFFYYQSRAIPDLNEENQMTVLPNDLKTVLGAATGPNQNRLSSIRIPILLYHYVEYVQNDPGKQKLNIPPNILKSQIETLKKDGFTFITPNELTQALAGKTKLPSKLIMLTFDDGYMDFYTDVFPILKEEQVKAALYVIPDFLNRPNFMFTFQLKEVAKNPLVEIGAHTMDHLALSGTDEKQATYQVAQSRKVLQDMLNLPINSFAYPYGSFDQNVVKIVKSANFNNAMSVLPGIEQTRDNAYYLFRLRPGYRTGKVLLDFLNQNTFKPW